MAGVLLLTPSVRYLRVLRQPVRYASVSPKPESIGVADAVPDRPVRPVLPGRARALVVADAAPARSGSCSSSLASYTFYAAANWRFCLLLGGGHARQPCRRRASSTAAATRAAASRSSPPPWRSTSACSRSSSTTAFFVDERRRRARHGRPRAAGPAADHRAARRHQLLHLPGHLVRGRRQARPRGTRRPPRRHGVPQLLPAPGRRPDRAGQRVPPAAEGAARPHQGGRRLRPRS